MTKINGLEMISTMVAIQDNKMAKEKNAKKAYMNDLIAQGIDKEIAKAMTKAMFDCGIVKAM